MILLLLLLLLFFFTLRVRFLFVVVVVVSNRFQMQFARNLVHKFKVRVLVHVFPARKQTVPFVYLK